MPRNASGVYTLPAGNPVTPLTVITTSWANPTLSDIGTEITNSLSRDGFGGMRAPFRLFDGTQALPGLAFANEPGVGWYRESASLSHIVTANTKVATIKPNRLVHPDQTEYRGVNAYKVVGQKSWLIQNIAGVLNIAPSTNIDAEDWDFTKASTWNQNTGVPSFPVVAGSGYVRITGDTMTGSLTINRDANSAQVGLVVANINAGAASEIATNLSVGTVIAQMYARHQTHASPEWGLTSPANLAFKVSTSSTVRLIIGGSGVSYFGAAAPVGWGGGGTGENLTVIGVNSPFGSGGNFRVFASSSMAIDQGGSMTFGGYHTAQTTSIDFAEISGRKETGGAGNTGGYLIFGTRVNAGNITERMRLTSTGNVIIPATGQLGVGVTPTIKFEVNAVAPGWGGAATAVVANIAAANAPVGNGGNLRIVSTTALAADAGGSIVLGGCYIAGTNSIDFAEVAGRKENATSGQTGGYLSLGTRANGGNLVEQMRITSDGRVYGVSLHNNAGAVTGTVNQYIASGTYTPTIAGVANVAASTARVCQWVRVGNVVTVSGNMDIDPTLAAPTGTSFDITLPIASAFSAQNQCGGAGYRLGSNEPVGIYAEAVGDKIRFEFNATSTANQTLVFCLTYLIV